MALINITVCKVTHLIQGVYQTLPVFDESKYYTAQLEETDVANIQSRDYRYNAADKLAYDVGPKRACVIEPQKVIATSPFAEIQGLYFKGFGKKWSSVPEGYQAEIITNFDYTIPATRLINGVQMWVYNAQKYDYLCAVVVDTTYQYAGDLYPATPTEAGIPNVAGLTWAQVLPTGVEILSFVTDWNVDETSIKQPAVLLDYIANFKENLTFRVKYHQFKAAAEDLTAELKTNFFLHEKISEE